MSNMINNLNYHKEFDDIYFAVDGGFAESTYVFVDANGFPERFSQKGVWHIAETGYGTGLNFMALLHSLPDGGGLELTFSSVELYPIEPLRCREIISPLGDSFSESREAVLGAWSELYSSISKGWNSVSFLCRGHSITLQVYVGSVDELAGKCIPGSPVDAWFLDGHDPRKNPEMWSLEAMSFVGANRADSTTYSTFSCARIVKDGVTSAGFNWKKRKGHGRKREMLFGVSL